MVGPSRHSRGEGMTTNKWLSWTLFMLYATTTTSASAPTHSTPVIASGTDPPLQASSRLSQAGRSPAEIPLLNHEIPTAKFRNTNEEIERFQALAPASYKPVVRAPAVQSTESVELSLPDGARRLSEWEADDIILLSTIDGALHARDRRTGRQRWTLNMSNPMIQAVHLQHNRSSADVDDLQVQDDYIFIVEPSADGQLYAQFADPAVGLVHLQATVRKMATEVPYSLNVNGHRLATTSSQDFRAYTIDAQTGHILHEFPKSKSSVKIDPQPRCRPRSGLDFEDPACKPGRTLRLGRNTYTFTISSEETNLDLCTIRYSEWVTNRGDKDLQTQHTTPLDEYDVRVFHNGKVMGLDMTPGENRPARWQEMLESPVARVFDVARKVDEDDDSSDLVLLSRSSNFQASNEIQLLQEDSSFNQRVFVNRTKLGQWYAMSEASYPGVTTRAMLANVEREDYLPERLNLHGDMHDIIGVHRLSGRQTTTQKQYQIAATPEPHVPYTTSKSDLVLEPPKSVSSQDEPQETSARWKDQLWAIVGTLVACALAFSLLPAATENRVKAISAQISKSNIKIEVPTIHVASPTLPENDNSSIDISKLPEVVENVAQGKDVDTPAHSRAQSTVSIPSPGKNSSNEDDNQSDDGDSDNENNENEPQRKKRKTKRGARGGRGKKKRAGDATSFEPKPIISPEKHLKDGMVQVGRLTYDSKLENCLGQGSSGTAVFPGTFEGRLVAVKRLIKTANSLAEKEIRHLVSSDEHPNVIRYHGKEESPSFFYIALDKFDTSLDQFVEFYDKYPSLVSPTRGYDVKDALRQITRGVMHLHSLKLVHRDIKPQNILVRPVKTNRAFPEGSLTPLLFVISDFGLCKPLEDGPESVFAATRTAAGTTGWKAPELLVSSRDAIAAPQASIESIQSTTSQSHHRSTTASSSDSAVGTAIDPPTGRRATKAIDIFSLGCVFFYVLTRGAHPFDRGGSPLARDLNIKNDAYDTSLLRESFIGYDYDADDLIMTMIMHNPKARPDTAGVLTHPYFWKNEQKLDFLCAVSDNYEERKQKVVNIHDENAVRSDFESAILRELDVLQDKAENVIGVNKQGTLRSFLDALPKSFLGSLGKQRKYTGTRMIDLLRAIRNKKNHFHELPTELKGMMLKAGAKTATQPSNTQIEGYYAFWRDRFPSLLVNCHQLVLERGLVEEFGLERYYDGSLL